MNNSKIPAITMLRMKDLFHKYLSVTDDKIAAAILVLADVLRPSAVTLTVQQAADRLHLSSKLVYQMCQDGRLGCFRAGRAVRVPLEEIERFQDENTVSQAGYNHLT